MLYSKFIKSLFLVLIFSALCCSYATGQTGTFYVRTDGGDAAQCTGLANAPYPGSGMGMACAWDHPFRALPPGGPARISGGDALIIGSGSYRMGYAAPGADNCDAASTYDCSMAAIPSGPDPARPTRVLGVGWDQGCSAPPELWGAERTDMVLNLIGSSNVEVACLEITDRSGCVESHSGGLACERDSYPHGDWAVNGLVAHDSANVTLRDLNIHGLAHAGVYAGRLRDWRVEDVRIAANGWAGWHGDIYGDDANHGTMHFQRWTVEWNGCAETWPGGQPAGCWGQTAGGYGDGVGTGATGGHWIIEDSVFRYNTSDGLDLLYHRLDGSITLRRTAAYGNAGDQFKTSGMAHLENVVAVSHCSFFEGKPFTHHVDNCRAGGSALALALKRGSAVNVVNSTFSGQGDCLVIVECGENESCSGNEQIRLRNSIFLGHPEFLSPGDTTSLSWHGTARDPFHFDYSIFQGLKNIPSPCPTGSFCDIAPSLTDARLASFDARLTAGSPAIDAGTPNGAPADDILGRLRDSRPDIGAYEHGAGPPPAQDSLSNEQWITSFYVAYWDRAPDAEGHAYWMGMFNRQELTIPGIAENFALSDEAKAMYPYFNAPETATDAERGAFVRAVYRNLLDREVSGNDEGVLYWVGELRSGASTPGLVIGNIIYAAMQAGGADWQTIWGKVLQAQQGMR